MPGCMTVQGPEAEWADGRLEAPVIEVGELADGPRFLQRVLDRDVVGKLVLRV